MKTFLQELAEKVYKQHPVLDEVTLIFPNRRAILYFRKHLSALLDKPAFSPRLLTIEEFIGSFSTLQVPDKLELIYQLYKTYNHIISKRTENGAPAEVESIDQFYFWGDMLLRDFDEIDKYMVNAVQLFKDLSHQKELDASFDFLTEEQKEFLKSFWGNFDETQSANKKKFLYVWRKLPEVYRTFKERLFAQGLAYEGMLHEKVAQELVEGKYPQAAKGSTIKFAGFNALTSAEEKILSYFVERGAEVYWDMDAYYVNNAAQEAGKFFREYQQHPILKKTFPADIASHSLLKNVSETRGSEARIKIFGAAQPVGQAKLMAQVLKEELAKGTEPEDTLIILPDEKLLLPVLHGVSSSVEKLNVTMGFPLSSTPMFNFIELLMDLQISRKEDHFNHRQVLALLGHPYVVTADAVAANNKRKEILKHNWVHIPKSYLATEVELHRTVFEEVSCDDPGQPLLELLNYLKIIVTTIGALKALGDLDKEYAFHFLTFFNRLRQIFDADASGTQPNQAAKSEKSLRIKHLKSFLRLFRQLIQSNRIPFKGEPLRGLQVMGVLETRNLDFKNVFILSLNEGAFPAISSKGSYVPYTIRKAYGLPTVEHQDAIYSYLFYRGLQRAENVFIFYNSETDVLGQGEMSRYLQQLLFESGLPIEKKILHNSIQPKGIHPITVRKNAQVMEGLMKLNEGNIYFKGISPSALNSYIECRLKFYFRHVAKIREADEVEEELDARVLGNFLHDVMERFYKRIGEKKQSKLIEETDFVNYDGTIDVLIDEVFIEAYRLDPSRKVLYEGQRLVVKEVVKRFAHRIIEMDKAYVPFTIEALEQEGLTFTLDIEHAPHKAVIGGKIDRVDRKGNLLRVIDYKTGKDKLNFESVASLFTRDGKRNKAAFQTLLYALLYKQNYLSSSSVYGPEVKLIPGLINRMNLFDEGFSFGLKMGREPVTDVTTLLPEFESRLQQVFEELFDPEQPFDQTEDLLNCKMCPYRQICYR
jgi:CRISPR/Cas system-associated exonuclease Cas4 (RecB family)